MAEQILTTVQEKILEVFVLPKDLREAADTLEEKEARYLVDLYYEMQEFRKATGSQVRALEQSEEPNATIFFFMNQFFIVEKQIAKALDTYSASKELGQWARSQVGIGPVISAGLLAHIDLDKAPTAGAIWRFAGLDPSVIWEKGQKRPWNAELKKLCWKIGDSFVKVSGKENAFYGQLYKQRKEYELERDLAGLHADEAKKVLATKTFKKLEVKKIYESGHLPAGHLDARARRFAVKMFLSHYFEVGLKLQGKTPPKPFVIEHLGHTHYIAPPNMP